MDVEVRTRELGGSPLVLRWARAASTAVPLLLHGIPGDSADWSELLERRGGIAPDMPGFGRSGKGGHLDYSPRGQAAFLQALLDDLGVGRVTLVAHGWSCPGAIELTLKDPGRVERLVLCSPPAPSGSAGEPRHVRLLRRRVVGELLMGMVNRRVLSRHLRQGAGGGPGWPEERLREVWEAFDQGTQRAILRILRAGFTEPPPHSSLAESPVHLVVGGRDPWLDAGALASLERALAAQTQAIDGAGHWPWLAPAGAASIEALLS